MPEESAAQRASRDVNYAQGKRVKDEYASQDAERLARLYVNAGTGANTEFDGYVADAVVEAATDAPPTPPPAS